MAKGFTLIELIVTLGIFAIISSLIFANYPEFKAGLALKQTTQEIALALREAQVYAVSVRSFQDVSGEKYEAYGIHFDVSVPDTFLLFTDLDNDRIYDLPPTDGAVSTYKIQTGDRITGICGNKHTNGPGDDDCGLIRAEVVFYRPEPLVFLNADDGSGYFSYSDLEMTVTSTRGKTKKVIIYASGQISIE